MRNSPPRRTRPISLLTGIAGLLLTVPLAAARAEQPTEPPPAASSLNQGADAGSYMIRDTRRHEDPEIGWKGFLSGLRGYENFAEPIGNPIYFESPFNYTGVRLIYLYNGFSDDCQLQGGQVNVAAAQVRVAITERWAFLATKDGYSWLDAGIGIDNEGWNDLAAGVKYTFYADKETDLVAAAGVRYMMDRSGEAEVLQGGVDELSPFVTVAKGWGKFHLIADITDRIPFDNDDGNNVLQWDIHADYDVGHGIFPTVELHGLHYLSDGEKTPLSVGGLDYSNLGSTDVSGSTVIWLGVGSRFKFSPHTSLGATFEYPLTNRNADILGERVTVDFAVTW